MSDFSLGGDVEAEGEALERIRDSKSKRGSKAQSGISAAYCLLERSAVSFPILQY